MEDFRETLEQLFKKHGGSDFCWIDPKSIEVAEWVRMKCRFGCDEYGRNAACPPNTPPVEACRRFFNEYTTAVDVFATVGGIGFPIDMLSRYDQEMNRYAFLMID